MDFEFCKEGFLLMRGLTFRLREKLWNLKRLEQEFLEAGMEREEGTKRC